MAGRERSRSLDEMYSGFNEQNRVNLLKMVYLYGNNGTGKSKLLTDQGDRNFYTHFRHNIFPQKSLSMRSVR